MIQLDKVHRRLFDGVGPLLLALFFALPASARDVDDQIRYTNYMPGHHDMLMEMGFNFFSWGRGAYDFRQGTVGIPDAAYEQAVLKRLEQEGCEVIVAYSGGKHSLAEKFPRMDQKGKPFIRRQKKLVDPAAPGCMTELAKGAKALASEYKALGSKAVVGFRGLEEVRLSTRPSFTEANNAAYKAYAGVDIPAEVKGRECPAWSKIKDFPADRIVDEDHPLLKYYRWFWQQGDGWSPANDAASAGFSEGLGQKAVSVYAPVLRMPYLWGIGGNNSHLAEWVYLTPFPFLIRYQIAEMQASARGTGAAIIPGVDGIFRSKVWLPEKFKPAQVPAWYPAYADKDYVTIPPDWAREAFWLMASKQSDGIAQSVYAGVFGGDVGESSWATKTIDDTGDAVREFMTTVARPLGPLLKNMPEHAPEVAVLESYASAIFSGSAPWDWTTVCRQFGELLALGNLDQYALFEEEIARDGIPASVKAIFLPGCTVLTKTTAAKLREFQARGGRLFGEATLAPGVKADGQLPELLPLVFRAFKPQQETLERDAEMRAKIGEIKAQLGFPLYADSTNPHLLVNARSQGSADVVFVVNDKRGFGDYVGGWQTMLDKGLPNAGEVVVRRTAGAVYDLVRHTAVPFASEGGVTRIPVAFETSDGKVLLVVAKPLAPLVASVAGGKLRVTSSDTDVMVPFGVMDAQGKDVVNGILRNGAWERPLPPGACAIVNYATGERVALAAAAAPAPRLAPVAAKTVPRLTIGMSGFSKVVCNEAGVRRLKAIGADYASGVKFDDTATLDLFQKYGLRAAVSGLPGWWGGKTAWAGQMAQKRPLAVFEKKLASFRPHPAMLQVTVGDEPSSLDFDHFAQVLDLVAAKTGGIVPRTPIFPDYGSLISIGDEEAQRQLGTTNYEQYVRTWCEKMKATDQLSIDFYPYSAPTETRASYFLRRYRTLGIGAKAARDFGKRYELYVQANSLFPETEMTLSKLRYQAFTDLAYGPDSLKFTCYTPSWWTNNILTATGEPTARYYAVQRVISELHSFDDLYMQYRCVGTRYLGFTAEELAVIGGKETAETPVKFANFEVGKDAKFVVADLLARDGSGRQAVLLAAAGAPEAEKVVPHQVMFRGKFRPVARTNTGKLMPKTKKGVGFMYTIPSDGLLFLVEPEK
ncbi:MAG: hypothetical protein MJ240_02160 [Kiritimatiellae bacterium]|nr:hypothetical protein [Kiritimatiellia bacterium]